MQQENNQEVVLKHMKRIRCRGLSPAENKGPRGRSIAPPPAGVGRRMERKWQKLVGRDKGSLTEQQTKQTVTTILIRRIYKTVKWTEQLSPPSAPRTPKLQPTSLRTAPPPSIKHDSAWYRTLCFFGQVGSARPAVYPPGFWWKLTLSWPSPGD